MHRVFAFMGACVVLGAACGPNLSDIHISSCMHSCNATAKDCLDHANAASTSCDPSDALCQRNAVVASETCITSCLDCLQVCVTDMEKTLK